MRNNPSSSPALDELPAEANPACQSDFFHDGVMTLYHDFLKEVGNEAGFEDGSSGYHALKDVYSFYDRNMEHQHLRKRLGLEAETLHTDQSGCRGCLHPEILSVLIQDAFYFESLCLDQSIRTVIKKLYRHLNKGNRAVVLMRRRHNGKMHWVAVRKTGVHRLLLDDSLYPQPYTVSPQKFMRDCALSCLLVRPMNKKDIPPSDTVFIGSVELLKAVNRYHDLKLKQEGSLFKRRGGERLPFRIIPRFL